MRFLDRWQGPLLSILRIVTALLFIEHGTMKLFAFPAPVPVDHGGMPAVMTLGWFAGILEAGGGLAVLLGIFTRPVAFLLSGEMAVAYWMAHFPMSPFPALNMGDAAILFCFVFLFIAAVGPGPWAIDARRKSVIDEDARTIN